MTEQIRVDEVITNIMYQLQGVIQEQERLNQAKMILYMACLLYTSDVPTT